MEANWISVTDRLPDEGVAVFITNGRGWYAVGCCVYLPKDGCLPKDGWFWAESVMHAALYEDNGHIVVECDIDDDLVVTHWHEFPKPYKP